MTTPTRLFYGELQKAYDHFNQSLFSGQLPACMITMQREKNVMGYFSAQRWGNDRGQKSHEIALNPTYFSNHSLIDIFQTIVHEQVHLWQHEHGKPGRRGYHNKEWANKMESIGLMPSDTGFPGGRRTGEKMSDYPVEDGRFLAACNTFIESGFTLPWIDRQPAVSASCQPRQTEDIAEITATLATLPDLAQIKLGEVFPEIMETEKVRLAARSRRKVKYSCSGCQTNVWGKPGLHLICGGCELPYIPQEQE